MHTRHFFTLTFCALAIVILILSPFSVNAQSAGQSQEFIDKICQESGAAEACQKCPEGFPSAIGCIPVGNLTDLTKSIVTLMIGIGGGTGMLMILFGAFLTSTSSGQPDKLQKGRELVFSAIAGIAFMALSVIILQLIGVEIIQLPGLVPPVSGGVGGGGAGGSIPTNNLF